MNVDNLCAVTKELLYDTANAYPDILLGDGGEVKIQATLFTLGFYIDREDYLKGVRIVDNVYIRHPEDACHVYKTTLYTGNIRNAVLGVEEGKIVYDRSQYHHLQPLYNEFEVLQSFDINKHVSKEDLEYILDVGWDFPIAKREPVVQKEEAKLKPKDPNDTPYWKDKGYTAMEWRQRKFFENHSTQADRDCMYVSEFDDLTAEGGL